ncbi:MAG: putative cupredoxin-like copper-binding protein [Gammaproteobacteria bacterium]|jgi:uncharacterized cupredoxin-like copper-binding protein
MSLKQKEFRQRLLANEYGVQNTKFWSIKMKRLLIIIILLIIMGVAAVLVIEKSHHSDGNGAHDHGGTTFSVGEPAEGNPDRTIKVSMLDTMRFEFNPAFDEIHDDEVIEFIIKNDGMIRHEFSIGNAEDQVKHAEMMKNMPDMKHNDPNTVSLAPGEVGNVIWRFKNDETVVFACNELGHFEAGMRHDSIIKVSGHSH